MSTFAKPHHTTVVISVDIKVYEKKFEQYFH